MLTKTVSNYTCVQVAFSTWSCINTLNSVLVAIPFFYVDDGSSLVNNVKVVLNNLGELRKLECELTCSLICHILP